MTAVEAAIESLRALRQKAIAEGMPVPVDPDRSGPVGQLLERAVDGYLFAEVTRCGRCGGDGVLPEVEQDEHGYERPTPCPCGRLRIAAARLNAARLPADRVVATGEGWRRKFPGDSETAVRDNATAFAAVARLVKQLEGLGDHETLPRGLLLFGNPGTGKTHLASALLRRLAAGQAAPGLARRAERAELRLRRAYCSEHVDRAPKVAAVRYWAWPDCMQHLFGALRAKHLDLALDELAAVPVLALDELAAGAPSDFEAQTLNQLLVARHRLGTCTVVGTNYRLVEATPGDPEFLGNRLGAHAFSRLRLLEALPVAGVDRRPLVEAAR